MYTMSPFGGWRLKRYTYSAVVSLNGLQFSLMSPRGVSTVLQPAGFRFKHEESRQIPHMIDGIAPVQILEERYSGNSYVR